MVSAFDVCGLWAVGWGCMRRRQVRVWLIDGIIRFCILFYFSKLCILTVMYCSVYSVFTVPTGTLRLP